MLDRIEALRAFRETGTTAKAAVRLRLTQSAVSKRIAALEAQAGVPLIERVGRSGRLTPEGERLLRDASPLLAQLGDVLAALSRDAGPRVVRLAASESLLASWLPAVLARAQRKLPGVGLELHAHRGPALLARVLAGEADVAVAVDAGDSGGLVVRSWGDEPMVIVPSGLEPLRRGRGVLVDVWTIEERSLTWEALAPRLRRRERPWGCELRVSGRLESFTALARAAMAGLAHALVPRGVAVACGVPPKVLVSLPGLERPLALLTRRLALERPHVAALLRELESARP